MSAVVEDRPPPTYSEATSAGNDALSSPSPSSGIQLARRERNGIPPETRRSMEDEHRPLPEGWVRTYDPQHGHQFFVDTRADPPRSVWHHPYDDATYLDSLPAGERERATRLRREWSLADVEAESTDEDEDEAEARGGGEGGEDAAAAETPPSAPRRLGRRVKDRVTGTTHAQREERRRERGRREADLYRQHRIYRRGLEAAIAEGRPQLLGEDDSGRAVYLQPPGASYPGVADVRRLSPSLLEVVYQRGAGPRVDGLGVQQGARFIKADDGGWGTGMGGVGSFAGAGAGSWTRCGGAGLGGGGYPGAYGNRYRTPPYTQYRRPYGYGYGGGMGFPMMAPLFGGMMLGGLMC